MMIQSPPGRFLSVAIQLQGTGYATPVVTSLRITYPRASYLDFLPEIYSSDQEMRTFLERFLGIFQSEWDELERSISEYEANFDPDAVPGGVAMRELARWMALPLEDTWTDEQNRRLLQTFPTIQSGRGTPASLRAWIGVYLANIAGLTPPEVMRSGFPSIQEGFVERRHLWLNEENTGGLGQSKPLWSPEVIRRLQLGGFSQAGEVALVSTGDPDRDVFDYYAHRFRVYVPAAWIRTADQEAMLRRAIETEKPAHTAYELELVQPRFRIGTQSTIGLDTIIGTPAGWFLPCADNDSPPSREASSRLGYDTVFVRSSPAPSVDHLVLS
jgi:phage tail-like protein